MALPMAFGMVFMIAVNLIDTFWVGRLGTEYVAAMTYTFPWWVWSSTSRSVS